MAIAGKTFTILKSTTPEELECPNCGAKNSTQLNILGKYSHLFCIPFISKGKTGTSSCSQCEQFYEVDTMPDTVKLAYYELKETVKTPIWHYAGFIGIKVLVLIKIFSKYV